MSLTATIIIPTHDHGPTLRASVASALRQTVEDIEVLVIGDGAPDETRDIMKDLAAADDRVRYFAHPKGPRHGEIYRDQALTEARGEIVCYLSDDDLYLPHHVEVMRHLLATADFAHGLAARVMPDGSLSAWTVDLSLPAYRRELLEGRNRVPLSAGAHTMDAYRRLPEGWSTTPKGTPTDLYMWQKFLRIPRNRFQAGTTPTVLTFPSPERNERSALERLKELQQWLQHTATRTGTAALIEQVLALKVRDAAEFDARTMESPHWRDPLTRQALLQVFFPSPTGHNEADSAILALRTGYWEKLSVMVPHAEAQQSIRIDPAMEPCIVEFADISVRTLEGNLLWRLNAETARQLSVRGTAQPLRRGNSFRLFSDGVDPILELPALGDRLESGSVLLELLLRIDVDFFRLRNCARNRAGA